MSSECPDYIGKKKKSSWPELVGTNGDYAESVIERENSSVNAVVMLEGSPATQDLRCDRVRVWVNKNRIVVITPVVG